MTGKREKHNKSEVFFNLFQPIPTSAGITKEWQSIPIVENYESLVPIGVGSEYPELFTSSIYYGERDDSPYFGNKFKGSLQTIFVRESVAKQLISAQQLLPPCHYLVIYDAYRSFEVQQSLYNRYKEALIIQNPTWPLSLIESETQKFVSQPSTDIHKPSPHNTGGAVDLAIIKIPIETEKQIVELKRKLKTIKNLTETLVTQALIMNLIANAGQLLDFGTPFDYGGKEANLIHFEKLASSKKLSPKEQDALNNRRLLYNVLTRNGFQGFDGEWWHFNSDKTQMGARSKNKNKALYGPIQLTDENITHERKARKYTRRITALQNMSVDERALLESKHLYEFFIITATILKDIRQTSLQPAVTIVPPEKE